MSGSTSPRSSCSTSAALVYAPFDASHSSSTSGAASVVRGSGMRRNVSQSLERISVPPCLLAPLAGGALRFLLSGLAPLGRPLAARPLLRHYEVDLAARGAAERHRHHRDEAPEPAHRRYHIS